jgi:hypothetical protein
MQQTIRKQAPKKKTKPSPTSMPDTPEVEVPPKASSSTASSLKDVIILDDIPETVANSGQDASPSKPPPEEPENTLAEARANDATKKLLLSGAIGTPQTHPHLFSILQKIPLAQRHSDVKN